MAAFDICDEVRFSIPERRTPLIPVRYSLPASPWSRMRNVPVSMHALSGLIQSVEQAFRFAKAITISFQEEPQLHIHASLWNSPNTATLCEMKLIRAVVVFRIRKRRLYSVHGEVIRMNSGSMCIFALGDSRGFGEAVAARLGIDLSAVEEMSHEDGEARARVLEDVRHRDVYVIHSLAAGTSCSVHDKLCLLLFFTASLHDAGAMRVTVVAPYLCYARKDRRTKPGDPLATRILAQLFESVGVDRMVTMDVHNISAFENAYRMETEHLEARLPLARAVLEFTGDLPLSVVSPDIGGVKRAERFRTALEQLAGREVVPVFMEKYRSEGEVSGKALVGQTQGRAAVIVDDMMVSGTTLLRAVEACRNSGAERVIAAVTHGPFAAGAEKLLQHKGLDNLLLTTTVPPRMQELWGERVRIVPVEPLVADALAALHEGKPLSDLLELQGQA